MVSAVETQVRTQLEALVLRPLLQPLIEAFGEYGDIAEDEFARVLAGELQR